MKSVRRGFLLLYSVLCFAMSRGQTFTLSPNDTMQMECLLEDYEDLLITQDNVTNGTLTLKWSKLSESVPQGWDLKICDNKLCYNGLEPSGEMLPVGPGEWGMMSLKANPRINAGVAVVRYLVWDDAFPLLKDTLTWIVKVHPVSIAETSSPNMAVWSDPTQYRIGIRPADDQAYELTMHDSNGKLVFTGMNVIGPAEIFTGDLAAGVYVVAVRTGQSLFRKKVYLLSHD